jgi:hypothetical protein
VNDKHRVAAALACLLSLDRLALIGGRAPFADRYGFRRDERDTIKHLPRDLAFEHHEERPA